MPIMKFEKNIFSGLRNEKTLGFPCRGALKIVSGGPLGGLQVLPIGIY